MNILKQLMFKHTVMNKKRTIVMIVGIVLSISLIIMILSLTVSFKSSIIDYLERTKGNYHYMFRNVPSGDINKFDRNVAIDSYFITRERNIGIKILEIDKQGLNNLPIVISEGRMISDYSEILISKYLRDSNSGYQIGNIINGYLIVGVMEWNDEEIDGITLLNQIDRNEKVDLYVKYTEYGLKNRYFVTSNILGIDNKIYSETRGGVLTNSSNSLELEKEMALAKYSVYVNQELVDFSSNSFHPVIMKVIYVIAGIILLIIIITSIYCIRNGFEISLSERIKEYGMLISIGMTFKQLRKSVLLEAGLIFLIGMPLGIGLGIGSNFIFSLIVNKLVVNDMGFYLKWRVSGVAILIGIILSMITMYFSVRKSMKIIINSNLINAIKGNNYDNSVRVKTPYLITRFFGLSGDIAYKNIFRVKGKYTVIITSVVIWVFSFVTLSSFDAFISSKLESVYKDNDYNLIVNLNSDGVYNEMITDKIVNIPLIREYAVIKQGNFAIKNPRFSEYSRSYYGDNYDVYGLTVESLSLEEYKRYTKKLGIKGNTEDKAILVDKKGTFDYKKGDVIKGDSFNEYGSSELSIEIAMVSNIDPLGVKASYNDVKLVVSEKSIDRYNPGDDIVLYIKTDKSEMVYEKIELLVKKHEGVYVENKDREYRTSKILIRLIRIFLYGIMIMISVVGLTNIFNTVSTSISLRMREYAIFKSIGMDSKQFNKMVRLESLFYLGYSLILGIFLGICLSYFAYFVLTRRVEEVSYVFPYKGIIYSVLIVSGLIFMIMRYSLRMIDKNSLMSVIRQDNI